MPRKHFIDFQKYKDMVGKIFKGEEANKPDSSTQDKKGSDINDDKSKQKVSGRENLDRERDRLNLERDNIQKDYKSPNK